MQQKMSKECFETLNQNCLLQYGADNSIKWIIPTQDRYGSKGCPKTLIKYIKRAIKIVIGEQTLSFLELQTVRLYIETCFRKEHMGGMQVARVRQILYPHLLVIRLFCFSLSFEVDWIHFNDVWILISHFV